VGEEQDKISIKKKLQEFMPACRTFVQKHKVLITLGIVAILFCLFGMFKHSYHDSRYGKFVKGPNMQYARNSDFDVIKLKDGKILVLGHNRPIHYRKVNSTAKSTPIKVKDPTVNYTPNEVYDPATNTFSVVPFDKDFYYEPHGMLLQDGKVLLTQVLGYSPNINSPSKIAVYNPKTDKIESVLDKKAEQDQWGTQLLLENGSVFMINRGFDAEVYDPKTNATKIVSRFVFNRNNPRAMLLDDGKVLVVGDGTDVEFYVGIEYNVGGSQPQPPQFSNALPIASVEVRGCL
jgi:nitrogen fixation protein